MCTSCSLGLFPRQHPCLCNISLCLSSQQIFPCHPYVSWEISERRHNLPLIYPRFTLRTISEKLCFFSNGSPIFLIPRENTAGSTSWAAYIRDINLLRLIRVFHISVSYSSCLSHLQQMLLRWLYSAQQ